MRKIAVLGMAISLAACSTVTPPNDQEFSKADFGQEISKIQFDKLALTNLKEQLVDPNSVMYLGSTPITKYWANDNQGGRHYGFFGCYDYNAKNRMGGYAGKKRHCLFVRNGRIVQIYSASWINDGTEVFLTPAINTIR